jgi:hypothetical protein
LKIILGNYFGTSFRKPREEYDFLKKNNIIIIKQCLSKLRKELSLRCKGKMIMASHCFHDTGYKCVRVILLGSYTNKQDQTSTAKKQDTTNDSIKIKESHT